MWDITEMGTSDSKGMPHSIDEKDKPTTTHAHEIICIMFLK